MAIPRAHSSRPPSSAAAREILASPWEYVKRLPGSAMREIGFVIAGPPLLLDSDELPTVATNKFLGACVADWLKDVDDEFIKSWLISNNSSSTRLGDHFAKCVEFVLRFAPGLGIDSIFCSVQALEPVRLEKAGKITCEELAVVVAEETENDRDKYERRRAKKLLRKLQRNQCGKSSVNTIGEFDFLFRSKYQPCDEKVTIEHWEVSVKYLLYVGPWEAFGKDTPEDAKWAGLKSSSVDIKQAVESKNERFLGCFLGPHVGETLADRKNRLKNQLVLSTKSSAFQTVKSLFGNDDIRVRSKALLQGYLFYETCLWEFLTATNSDFRGSTYEASTLNSMHWKGWWMDIEGFKTFALATKRASSKWYIVPKKEWLSPVVIHEGEEKFSKVLDRNQLVDTAGQVAEEATKLKINRMRRFLVAELLQHECGVWIEASRGFIVEDTWPDTKTYSPHGFVTAWNP